MTKAATGVVMLWLALAGLAACTHVQARTPEADPALVTPPPPPRVIVPVTITVPEPEPAPPAPAPARSNPPASRPPDRATPPATPPTTPVETPAAPPPVLQTTSNLGDLEQKTLAALAKANGDLAKVDPKQLGADAHAQYDTAKGFIRQAEAALKGKNLVYAKELADKAAALAGLLVR